MFTTYWIEMKYGFLTLALLAGLLTLAQTQAFSGLDNSADGLFDLIADLGVVGIFIAAVIANASPLLHIPYTMLLLSVALGGASLARMALMGVASGLGAVFGKIFSYGITLKLLGDNPTLAESSLLQWVKRLVNSHPRMVPWLLFIHAVTPLPDDTVVIPLALIGYDVKRIALPLVLGKVVHNLGIAAVFFSFTSWSADHVYTTVQADLALGILILFVMAILYQLEKARAIPSLQQSGATL